MTRMKDFSTAARGSRGSCLLSGVSERCDSSRNNFWLREASEEWRDPRTAELVTLPIREVEDRTRAR
jgi:hypothetical protein